MELVRDEDHRLALLLQPLEHLRQLCDALRGEHRGRLVEDEHPRASPQRLDDLHLLLVTKGEVDCVRIGVDLDAEQPGELGEALPCAFLVQPQPPCVAQHQVLEDGQRRNQRRVLRDGADAQLERRTGRRDRQSRSPRPGSCPRPGGAGPRGCRSEWTCRRRSRRAGSAPRRGGGSGRCGRSRAHPGTPS